MAVPPSTDNESESAPTLKTRYGTRLDQYGMKKRKGFRTFMVRGTRPVHRSPKRG